MRITLALLDKSDEDARRVATTILESMNKTKMEYVKATSPRALNVHGDIGSTKIETAHSSTALGSIFSTENSPIIDGENISLLFDGRIYLPAIEPSPKEAILTQVMKEGEKAVEKIINTAEGDFALIIAEPQRIIAGRDPMGVQPLYYGENHAYAALGSNRTVLRKLGIEQTRSFPPGHLARVTKKGIRFESVKTLSFSEPKHTTMQSAVDMLLELLERSVEVRVRNRKEIAIAFSGGLDSSLIAVLAKKFDAQVHLVHVSLIGRFETEEAKRAAEDLNLPLDVHLFREEDVANVVSKVVELIEDPDPLKTAVGIPFYWASQKAADSGFKLMLAGQGADELFGGYQRYVNEYCLQGENKARQIMFADVKRIHENNLERDKKICIFHNVELCLPFVSYQIAEFATRLPLELKIDCKPDSLRKLVLRRVGEFLGLPAWITNKPKKAMQYATGISSTLRKLAKKRKTTTKGYIRRLFVDQKPSVLFPDI